LAVVLDGEPPTVITLDEPTRGMDGAAKSRLATWLRRQAAAGCGVIVATHDTEFAARFADRVVLLAEGAVIADGPAREVLASGRWFSTETARILGRTPARSCLRKVPDCSLRRTASRSRSRDDLAARVTDRRLRSARRDRRLDRAKPPRAAPDRTGRDARRTCRARTRRVCRGADVKPITAIVFVCGMALGAGPGFSIGALAALISNMLLGQGPWTPWQMLAWGSPESAARSSHVSAPSPTGACSSPAALRALRLCSTS